MVDASDGSTGVVAALLQIPGVRAVAGPTGEVEVWAGGEVPRVSIDPDSVVGVESIRSPVGAPAVRLTLAAPGWSQPRMLVFVAGDAAFVPDVDAGRLRVFGPAPGLVQTVGDMPPVLGWSEVLRCLRAVEGSLEDLDRALAQVLVAAAGVEGARRVGVSDAEVERQLEAAIDRVRSV